jgi:hypothetical protein
VGFVAAMLQIKAHHLPFGYVAGAMIVYGAVIAVAAGTMAWMGQKIMRLRPSAVRRFAGRFIIAMVLYVLALLATIGAFMELRPHGVLAYVFAVAPAVPLVGAIVSMGVYLREERDEFERAMFMESALWATGGLLAIATVWGFLEMFGLVPHVAGWVSFSLWAMLFGLGQAIARRRYR